MTTTHSTHTPGPWKVTQEGKNFIDIGNNGLEGVCTISTPYSCLDMEHYANARLIAAAPELLEALKDAKLALQGLDRVAFVGSRIPIERYPEHFAYLKAYDKIEQAIARAEGRTGKEL